MVEEKIKEEGRKREERRKEKERRKKKRKEEEGKTKGRGKEEERIGHLPFAICHLPKSIFYVASGIWH